MLLRDEDDWQSMFTFFERYLEIKLPWLDIINPADVGTIYLVSISFRYLHNVDWPVIKCDWIEDLTFILAITAVTCA